MSTNYFIAIFGDPAPPYKDTIESGVYHLDPKYPPTAVRPGDVLLLYCTRTYAQHPMEAPGIGFVLRVGQACVDYKYFPFAEPATKSDIDQNLRSVEADDFKNIRFSSKWLFQIAKESFAGAVASKSLKWP